MILSSHKILRIGIFQINLERQVPGRGYYAQWSQSNVVPATRWWKRRNSYYLCGRVASREREGLRGARGHAGHEARRARQAWQLSPPPQLKRASTEMRGVSPGSAEAAGGGVERQKETDQETDLVHGERRLHKLPAITQNAMRTGPPKSSIHVADLHAPPSCKALWVT